jgi:predicted nucleotidyltransferase component of viral defense system
MIIQALEKVVEENKTCPKGYLYNVLKGYLQLLVLSFIYNSRYARLIFKGGSCLRICFGLPRLSEDLDFDYEEGFPVSNFFTDLTLFIRREQNFPRLETKAGKQRLYLKFPVLKALGLAAEAESDKLYLKVELSPAKKCNFQTEIQPIFAEGLNFLAKRYDLPTLMAGKMEAVLQRVWFRGKKSEITVKGRDYFDLYWYLEKGIEPNYDCLEYKGRKLSSVQVWEKIAERVEKVKPRDLEYDLTNLIENPLFLKSFCQNYQLIFKKQAW